MLKFQCALDQMPHSGRMRLISKILAADERSIECSAIDHNDDNFPLLIDGVLYSTVLCELGAQAAAAHQSLYQMQGAHRGLLVALQNVSVFSDIVSREGQSLKVSAEQLHRDLGGAIYAFFVGDGEIELLAGKALLKLEGNLT